MAAARYCIRRTALVASSSPLEITLPTFLVPALVAPTHVSRRNLSTTTPRRSRIGQTPLSIPPDVTFTIVPPPPAPKTGRVSEAQLSGRVDIEGPLGKLNTPIAPFIQFTSDEQARTHTLSILDDKSKHQRAMWGTTRQLLQNQILGVSEGHSCIIRLVGVGYRASIEDKAVTKEPEYPGQKFVSLKLGYSHPIEEGVPLGVTASTPQPTRILLQGPDKDTIKRFAASIREWRKPEPYKLKGAFVDGETLKQKAKKIK